MRQLLAPPIFAGLATLAACADPGPAPLPPPDLPRGVLDLGRAWKPGPPASEGEVSYEATFSLPADLAAPGSVLVLDGAWWTVALTVNGVPLPLLEGGLGPAEALVGPHLVAGTNRLQATVRPPTDEPRLVTNGSRRALTLGRSTVLGIRPPTSLRSMALVAHGGAVQGVFEVEGAPAGARVDAWATLDGRTLQSLGGVPVDGTTARLEPVRWRGSWWRPDRVSDDALFQVVARLSDPSGAVLDQASWRTGVRSVAWSAPDLELNRAPWSLLSVRATPNQRPAPQMSGLPSGGINALELHGDVPDGAWFDEADELGIPVVVLPRCDGSLWREMDGRTGGPRAAVAASPSVRAQDRRLASATAPHPSLVMWACEGAPDTASAVCEGLDDDDPADRPVVGRAVPGWPTSPRLRLARPAPDAPTTGWVVEVADSEGVPLATVAETFLSAAGPGHLGGVIPPPSRQETAAWSETWSQVARRIGAPPLVLEGRRASSRVRVEGLAPLQAAWLEVPGLTPVGILADGVGRADLSAWHEGPATVRVDDARWPVDLVAGRWVRLRVTGDPPVVRLEDDPVRTP